MKLVTFTVVFLTLTITSAAFAQQPIIYGAYQDCLFHCRTIKINPNHTFEYRLNGDLYNDERVKGTWKFVGRNKIRATSPVDRSRLQVKEKPGKYADYFSFLVIDPTLAIVQGAIISGESDGRRFSVTTTSDGVARIPKCRYFELSFKGYRGNHRVSDPSTREVVVTLTVDQLRSWAINDTWVIEGKRLYIAREDGTFDRGSWLDKLSNEEAQKIFVQLSVAPNKRSEPTRG